MTQARTEKLGQIARFSQGVQVPMGEQVSNPPTDDYVRFIRIVDYTQSTDDIRYVKNPGRKFWVDESDIVMVRYGPIGVVGRGKAGVIANNMFKVTPDESLVEKAYLYYCLSSDAIRNRLIRANTSTTMPAINFSMVEDLDIPLPTITIQRRIVAILSAYDKLMENSRQRVRALEAMARAIYRELLRGTTAEVSNKSVLDTPYWKFVSANLSRYEGTKRYFATADIEKLTIQGAGIDYSYADKPSRAQKQPTGFSVWFARMKDTYKIAWYTDVNSEAAEASMLSSGFAGFQAIRPCYFPLLFLTVSSQEFHTQKDLFCTGATQISLTNEGLAHIQVPIPNESIASRIGEKTLPLLNQILVLQMQIQNLRRTRDLLLPRLLSGQVNLKDN